jgi:hypothetical protein
MYVSTGVNLYFDWSQSFVNAELSLGIDDADTGADLESDAEHQAKERANRRRRRFEYRKQLAIKAQAEVAAAAAAAAAEATTITLMDGDMDASPSPDMSPQPLGDDSDDSIRRQKTLTWLAASNRAMSASAPELATIVSAAPIVAQAVATALSSSSSSSSTTSSTANDSPVLCSRGRGDSVDDSVHVHVEPSAATPSSLSAGVRVTIAPTLLTGERKVDEKGPLSRASSLGSTNGDLVLVPSVTTTTTSTTTTTTANNVTSSSTTTATATATAVASANGVGVAAGVVARASRWSLYKSWDVVRLTKNYLWLMLSHIADTSSSSGLLVHCISGWDRTPLFVSLLRLTLWADGEIHRSLSPSQILYLTTAYDWMLFGHHLSNRLGKGEDVFYFCFDFLQYITHECYSLKAVHATRNKSKGDNDSTEKKEDKHAARQRKIAALIAKVKSLLDAPNVSPSTSSSSLSMMRSSSAPSSGTTTVSATSSTSSTLTPSPTNGSPVLLPSQSPMISARTGSGDKRVPVHNGNGNAASSGRPSPPIGHGRVLGLAGGRSVVASAASASSTALSGGSSEEKLPGGAFIRREHSGNNLVQAGQSVGETSGRWLGLGSSVDTNADTTNMMLSSTAQSARNNNMNGGLVVSASHDEVGHGALSVDDHYFATTPDRKESLAQLEQRRAKFGLLASTYSSSNSTNGTSVSLLSSMPSSASSASSSSLFTKETTPSLVPASSPPSGPSVLGALLLKQRTQSAENATSSSSSTAPSSSSPPLASSSTPSVPSSVVVTSAGRAALPSSSPPTSSPPKSSSPHIVTYHPSSRSSPPLSSHVPLATSSSKPPPVPPTRSHLRVDSFASPPSFTGTALVYAEPSPSHSPFDSPRDRVTATNPSLVRTRSDSLSSESGFAGVDDFTPPREASKPMAIGRPITTSGSNHSIAGSQRGGAQALNASGASSRRQSARLDDEDLCGSNPVDVSGRVLGTSNDHQPYRLLHAIPLPTTNSVRNRPPSLGRPGSSSLSTSWTDVTSYLGRSASANNLQGLIGSVNACTCGGMSICRACSTSSVGSMSASAQALQWDPNATQTLTIGHMTGGSLSTTNASSPSLPSITMSTSSALIRHPSATSTSGSSSSTSSPILPPMGSPQLRGIPPSASAPSIHHLHHGNTSPSFLSYTAAAIAHGVPGQQQQRASPLLLSHSLPVMVPALTLTDGATVTPTMTTSLSISPLLSSGAMPSIPSPTTDPIRQRFNDLINGDDPACLSPLKTLKCLRQLLQVFLSLLTLAILSTSNACVDMKIGLACSSRSKYSRSS